MFAGGGALPGACGPPLSAHCTLMSGRPRKAKSAADIKSLMQHECGPARTSRSMLPMTVGAAAAAAVAERRVSCAAAASSSLGGYGGGGGGGGGGGYGSLMVSAVKERRSCSLFPSPASAGTVAEKRLFSSSSSTTTPPAPCLCDVPFGGQSSSSSWASAKRDFLMTPSTSLGGGTGFGGGSGSGRRTSCGMDHLCPTSITLKDRRPSFNNVIAQVTAERRPSSSMLRISNV